MAICHNNLKEATLICMADTSFCSLLTHVNKIALTISFIEDVPSFPIASMHKNVIW